MQLNIKTNKYFFKNITIQVVKSVIEVLLAGHLDSGVVQG